jgi:GNAT superfamily N-acetyltransferase
MSAPHPYPVRRFRDGDADAALRLIHATIDACYAGVYPPRAVAFFKEHHSAANILQRASEGTTLVAEADGRVVGVGSLVGDQIQGVFVGPELQRRGIGGAIMAQLEALAQAAGVAAVTLHVSLPSRRFYERLGYRAIEATRLDVGEGQYLDYFKAEKLLGGSPGASY